MDEATWEAVDRYIDDLFVRQDAALAETLRVNDAAGLPPISVSAAQGRFLQIIAQAMGARRVLELGTLGGYSTICFARALPADGRVVTIEVEQHHADVARANLQGAGMLERVEILVGPALEILPQLVAEKVEPFDFIFIDADKENYPAYFEWCLRLARVGSLIVADNVVRKGEIVDAHSDDARVQGARRFNELVARTPGLQATILQTVGNKSYDGFLLARVEKLSV